MAAVFLSAMPADAYAQSKPAGRISAVAYGQIPNNASFSIQFRPNSELNNRLREVFERELRAQGYNVNGAGAVTLFFETLAEEMTEKDKSPVTLHGGGGGVGAKFKLALPLKKPKLEKGRRRYSLNVTVGRTKEPSLWSASAVAAGLYTNRYSVQETLVKAVIRALGRTVEAKEINFGGKAKPAPDIPN